MEKLRVDIWSDIACPWCYVGKRRLQAALARFEHRERVEIVWHAFELDPSAPRVRDESATYAERLAKKYGTQPARAEEMIRNMTDVAARDGLDFRFDRIRPGNTFDAHRLVHLAGERGLQDAMKERLLRAYLTEGEAIGEPATLVRLATSIGFEPDEIAAVLATDAHAAAVRADEAKAGELGITGVPFFVLGGRLAVSGAQPSDVLLGALDRAWREAGLAKYEEGATCGPDGCA